MKKFFITVKHTDNPENTFYINWVKIDEAFNVDWDISPNMDHALEVDIINKARAVIACIKSSVIIKGYTFQIIEVTIHD